MKTYIRTEIVQAEPMTDHFFKQRFKDMGELNGVAPGYRIIHPDDHTSWSSKEAFEATYHEIPYFKQRR